MKYLDSPCLLPSCREIVCGWLKPSADCLPTASFFNPPVLAPTDAHLCYRHFSILILPLLLLPCFSMVAQNDTSFICGTEDGLKVFLGDDSAKIKKLPAFENRYRELLKSSETGSKSSVVYTIPVVVHIVHDGQPLGSAANPTDATVQAVIAEASARFRHMHPGAGSYSNPFYGVDTEIELCLAKLDPNGNYTTGVVRHYDPVNAIGPYTSTAPGLNNYAWNKSLYCNIFLQTHLTNACGVMTGYDIVIVDGHATCFWSGLICHELGHYFSLAHTFGGACPNDNCLTQGDFVCDTPPKAMSGGAGGTCAAPANSCTTDDDDLSTNNPYRPVANGGLGDQPDMLANYLDYTGGCWDSYTAGQKTRMRTQIDTYRVALKNNSAACNAQPPPANDAGITSISVNQLDPCTPAFTPQLTLKNYGTATLTSANILVKVDGVTVHTQPWAGSLAPGATQTVTVSAPVTVSAGSHGIGILTASPNGSADGNIYNDDDYRSMTYVGGLSCQPFSACANFNPNTFNGPGNTTVVNVAGAFPTSPAPGLGVQICVAVEGDVDWYYEHFKVYDESGVFRWLTNHQPACSGLSPVFCFIASLSEYNTWKADGIITVTLDPEYAGVIAISCPINQACISVNVPQTCVNNLTLNGNIPASTYQAAISLQSDGLIQIPASVIFTAGSMVELLPGFEVQLGAVLEVLMQGCN